jgi:hypothetical protein
MSYTAPGQPPVQPPAWSMPDDVARLAAMYSMGPFFKAYYAEKRSRALLIGCPVIILGPPLLCGGLTALLVSSYAISEQMGLNGLNNTPQLIAGGIAIVIMAIFARLVIPLGWKINASGTSVYLFQNGIIHSKGTQTTPLFWQHITSAQLMRPFRYNPRKLVLKTFDKRTITLHSIPDLAELEGRVQQMLAYRQARR